MAVSEVRAGEWAQVSGVALEEVEVMPNGVDAVGVLGLTERMARLAERVGLWESELTLLQPAQIHCAKGFHAEKIKQQ